ncbi:uncharacterized protein G2W53_030816 [Senna tora]|uniref:Uncharacterized protein n=1 Tax=Senna tora TaxID=362788 RepID=A0A834WBX9_9FABA|nr:uncharacterized protein G2W53_030816 [Senna tora]
MVAVVVVATMVAVEAVVVAYGLPPPLRPTAAVVAIIATTR